MERRPKHNMSVSGTAKVGRLNSPIVTDILSLWLPALIVALFILGVFPF
jgi:hypothetical protein